MDANCKSRTVVRGHSSGEPRLHCIAARRRSDLRAAFRIIYDRYSRDGLANSNRFGIRLLPHQLLDSSWVLLAKHGNRNLGTLSLVEDGAMGLPIEQLYPEQIWQMRRESLRVAELACFALVEQRSSESMAVLRGLLQSACEIAFLRQIDELVICVHPDRSAFYERRLGFKEFGPRRDCPWVCDRPAVAMKLLLQAGCLATDLIARRNSHSREIANLTSMEALNTDDRTYFRQLHNEVAFANGASRCAA
jgi:hypothetical protein